jgi:hypothetical protein
MKTKEEFMYGVGTHHMGLPKKHEVTTWVGTFLLGVLVGVLIMGPP